MSGEVQLSLLQPQLRTQLEMQPPGPPLQVLPGTGFPSEHPWQQGPSISSRGAGSVNFCVSYSDFRNTGSDFFNLFSLFLAARLLVAVPAFLSCGERELLLVVVRGLLIAVASLVAEHGL